MCQAGCSVNNIYRWVICSKHLIVVASFKTKPCAKGILMVLAGWDAFNLSPPDASEDQGRAFQLTQAELQWFKTVLCCASPAPLETLQKYIKKI